MNELDRKIREALRKEDAELLEDFPSETSMYEMILETFRGRHRWLVAITFVWSLVFFVLSVVCAVKFFGTDSARDQLMWAGATILCMSAVSMLKLWYFMELNKNAVMREIKRLELQVARLAGRIAD